MVWSKPHSFWEERRVYRLICNSLEIIAWPTLVLVLANI